MNFVRRMRGLRVPVLLLLVVASILLGPGVVRTYALHSTTFPANATGLAVTPTRFLIVRCDVNEVKVQSVAGNGSLSDFAQTSGSDGVGGCLNPSIGIAPSTEGYIKPGSTSVPRENRADFRAGFAYFTQTTSGGTTIWQIDLAGNVTSFLTLDTDPKKCASPFYADLAFQTVIDPMLSDFQGPFGNHGLMFVTCTNGKIWKVNNAASPNAEEVKDLLTQGIDNIQGPSQATLGFTLAPGALCVASPTEGPGRVFCVTGTGGVVTVQDSWPDANGVDFVSAACRYEPGATGAAQGGSFYVSTPAGGGTIFKYLPATFKTSFANAAIVTRAGTNQPNKSLGKLTAGSGGTIAAFDAHPGRSVRDAANVDCSVPTLVIVDVSPGQAGTVINQKSQGTVSVAIVGSAVVPAISIDPLSVHCGLTGSDTESGVVFYHISDTSGPNGLPDGIQDFIGYFERTQMGLPGEPSPYRGPIICRGTYSIGADPKFDGGG